MCLCLLVCLLALHPNNLPLALHYGCCVADEKQQSKEASHLHWLLKTVLLPTAKETKDQWLEHMSLWMLGRKDDAVKALMADGVSFTPSTASFLKALDQKSM